MASRERTQVEPQPPLVRAEGSTCAPGLGEFTRLFSRFRERERERERHAHTRTDVLLTYPFFSFLSFFLILSFFQVFFWVLVSFFLPSLARQEPLLFRRQDVRREREARHVLGTAARRRAARQRRRGRAGSFAESFFSEKSESRVKGVVERERERKTCYRVGFSSSEREREREREPTRVCEETASKGPTARVSKTPSLSSVCLSRRTPVTRRQPLDLLLETTFA